MRYVLVTLVLSLFPGILYNQTVLQHFHLGNEAFLNQRYSDAIVQYERIMEAGYVSPELYFNIGLSYSELDEYVKARIFLERAHRLRPLDPDFKAGLDALREQIGDAYDFPKFPALNVVPAFRHYLGQKGVLYIGVVGFWSLALLWYFRKSIWKARYYLIAGGCINGIIIIGLILDLVLYSIEIEYAVINQPMTTLFAQPDPNSEFIEEIPAGTKIRIEEDYAAWTQVTLGSGSSGWVPAHPYTYLFKTSLY